MENNHHNMDIDLATEKTNDANDKIEPVTVTMTTTKSAEQSPFQQSNYDLDAINVLRKVKLATAKACRKYCHELATGHQKKVRTEMPNGETITTQCNVDNCKYFV